MNKKQQKFKGFNKLSILLNFYFNVICTLPHDGKHTFDFN